LNFILTLYQDCDMTTFQKEQSPMSQPKATPSWGKRVTVGLCIALTPVLLSAAALVTFTGNAQASSHREAPAISKDAYGDNTDTYVFISPVDDANIVFVGNWIPFEAPEGGPNYFAWDPSALYDIYVDTDGDAVANVTYTLSSRVDTRSGETFLYNTGPINHIADTTWNMPQYYTVTETIDNGTPTVLVGNKLAAPDNIGSKSTPNYAALEAEAIYSGPNGTKIFAGQTDDPFFVDLQVFDYLTLRGQNAPVGYSKGNNVPVDSLSGFNVHSLVIEVPISHIKKSDPVFGVWAGTRRQSTRVLKGIGGGETISGTEVQVSRLGLPLVNEVVIPLALKDAFNSIPPSADVGIYTDATLDKPIGDLLQKSVEDPEAARLLCALYGIPLPDDAVKNCEPDGLNLDVPRSGSGDIFDIYLTGMRLAAPFTIHAKTADVTLPAGFNVNRPSNPAINITGVVTGVIPAEMIRINTEIKGDTCSATPSPLGVFGGDACGFPNGRRLTDDVVDISLLAVAGAGYHVLDGRDAGFTFNGAAFIPVLSDNIDKNDMPFRNVFPYLALAQSGQDHFHTNAVVGLWLPVLKNNVALYIGKMPGGAPSAAGAGTLAFVALVMPAMVFMRRRKAVRKGATAAETLAQLVAMPVAEEKQFPELMLLPEDKDRK